jgi:molecular chaperone HscB
MLDPFDTLGLQPSFDIDERRVEQRYRELSRLLHPDKYVGKSAAERRMALGKAVAVNEAIRLLRDPIARALSLLARRGVEANEGGEPKADPGFLMQMMEAREALAEARASRDAPGVKKLAAEVEEKRKQALAGLSRAFATERPGAPALALVGELRYYRRFLDEVSAIEDDALETAPEAAASRF